MDTLKSAQASRWWSESPAEWLTEETSAADVQQIRQFLVSRGTFEFRALPTGLFPAAAGWGADFEASGYRNVWVRDNVHIAYALWECRQVTTARDCILGLCQFYAKHLRRWSQVRLQPGAAGDPQNRPHIRFDGATLAELPVKWAHAQNDALGCFLSIVADMVSARVLATSEVPWPVIAELWLFLEHIEFWSDADSGHWEEVRKVSASSIGQVVAALAKWRMLVEQQPEIGRALRDVAPRVGTGLWREMWDVSLTALQEILPAECRVGDATQQRRYDAALIFLLYPNCHLSEAQAEQILGDVAQHLTGPWGIRRYLGDSYWCADYRDLFSPEQRSADFSEDLASRDRWLQPGTEAQWCIFDPAVAAYYSQRLWQRWTRERDWDSVAWSQQRVHLQRSLAQLTTAAHRRGPFRCPESYALHRGEWLPNEITPLLWTQANLAVALERFQRTLELPERP